MWHARELKVARHRELENGRKPVAVILSSADAVEQLGRDVAARRMR